MSAVCPIFCTLEAAAGIFLFRMDPSRHAEPYHIPVQVEIQRTYVLEVVQNHFGILQLLASKSLRFPL